MEHKHLVDGLRFFPPQIKSDGKLSYYAPSAANFTISSETTEIGADSGIDWNANVEGLFTLDTIDSADKDS